MTRVFRIFFSVLFFSIGLRAEDGAAPRRVATFDAGWRFLKGDASGAEQPAFDDRAWATVDVPHDWSIAGPYDEKAPSGSDGGYLPTGVSWYRKSFVVPESFAAKKIFVEFDGVMANAEIWINGARLGVRPNGYISFSHDLTSYLRFGKANLLAVRTDTSHQSDSRWYTGQGIYRHTRLVVVNPVYIPRGGVRVATSGIGGETPVANVMVTVSNASDRAQELLTKITLRGPDGKSVAASETPVVNVKPGESADFVRELPVARPSLWDLASPNLYSAEVRLMTRGGLLLDQTSAAFGFRRIAFKADTGFWLNGKNIKIKGVCLHHDGGPVGAAVPLSLWERRLTTLRELGVNAIRTSHNPPAPEFLDLCDRMGFLVMLELFDNWNWNEGANRKKFREWYIRDWWERDARDTVLLDRNHPSVIIWSLGNEIPRPFGRIGTHSQTDALIACRDLIHRLDPTRPVTVALIAPEKRQQIPEFTDLMDVVGINYRPLVLPLVARDGKPVIATEETHELWNWAPYRDRPALSGCFLWTGVDYLGETTFGVGGWPYVISSNDRAVGFGLMDICGEVRPRGYQRQSWWSEKPMISMARYTGVGSSGEGTGPLLRDWTPEKPNDYKEAVVEVYSNASEAELSLNGKSLGVRQVPPSGMPLIWRFPYEPGLLKAEARTDGKVVASDVFQTAGQPARVILTSDRQALAPDFDEVAFVRAAVVDKTGVVCPNANVKLAFSTKGPGQLVALGTGDRTSHQSFVATERLAWQGGCLAIVRATKGGGPITVAVAAGGLPTASVLIQTKN